MTEIRQAAVTVPVLVNAVDLGPLKSKWDEPGIWVVASLYDPESDDVGGGTLYLSEAPDGSAAQWRNVAQVATNGVIGSTLSGSTVPTGISPNAEDWATKIKVRTYGKGVLEGATLDEVLGGANLAAWGGELIAFQRATLQSDGTYVVDGLLRGLYGTDDAMETHGAGLASEPFTLLDEAAVFVPLDPRILDVPRWLSVLPPGGTLGTGPQTAFTFHGYNARPMPVADLAYTRQPSGDVDLTWSRQSRLLVDALLAPHLPLAEITESYQIEILGSDGTVLRTPPKPATGSYTYSSADQTTDGVGSSAFSVRVAQVDPVMGLGRARTIEVPAP